MVNALMLDTDFLEASTMREQIDFACKFLRNPDNEKRLSFGDIAAFFHLNKGSVAFQDAPYSSVPKPPQRPRLLSDDVLKFISDCVQANFAEKTPVSYSLRLDEIQLLYGVSLRVDTLRHICRVLSGVKTVAGIPTEKQRVQVDQQTVADFYDELEAMIDGIPAAFIWNMDESGCDE
jgi:hypothetical protein